MLRASSDPLFAQRLHGGDGRFGASVAKAPTIRCVVQDFPTQALNFYGLKEMSLSGSSAHQVAAAKFQ